jgi:glycosyltransferase involved in cell wall biosynthesis
VRRRGPRLRFHGPVAEPPVRFCFLTTFFGAESFGGDATYVAHLSNALAQRGHFVRVVHCADAYRLVRRGEPKRSAPLEAGVAVTTLRSWAGFLSPLLTHQAGRVGFKARELRRLLREAEFDVVHFHNASLLGAPEILEWQLRGAPVRLVSAHDYWLVCPLSLLFTSRNEACESPACASCCIRGGRPVQLWRYGSRLRRAIAALDGLLAPSEAAARLLRERGIDRRIEVLPYFARHAPASASGEARTAAGSRPYVAAAGRFVPAKGFARLIRLMRALPDVELRIAGAGPLERELRAEARESQNVRFSGWLDGPDMHELLREAAAVVIPSAFPETFCYVALEAFSQGTPVVVANRGALPELVRQSNAGVVCDSDEEYVAAIRRLTADSVWRAELGANAREAVSRLWSEERHVARYLALIEEARSLRASARSGGGTLLDLSVDR